MSKTCVHCRGVGSLAHLIFLSETKEIYHRPKKVTYSLAPLCWMKVSYGSNMFQEYWKVWPKVAVDFSTKNIKNAASDILNTWLFNTLGTYLNHNSLLFNTGATECKLLFWASDKFSLFLIKKKLGGPKFRRPCSEHMCLTSLAANGLCYNLKGS